MNRVKGRIVIPYIGIDQISETLGTAYKKGTREVTLIELASLLGCSVSNINNVTPTLGLLGLANVKKGTMSITSDGMEFIRAFSSNELERAKEIIRKGIEKSEVLKFVRSLLETRVQLTGEEIGRALSDRFEKKWKSVATHRTHGNSCASIVGFAGLGFYYDGVLSLKPMTAKVETTLYAPEIGFRPIIRLLTALYPFERAKSSDLASKLKAKEGRISKELSVCVVLGLVKKDTAGGYRVTENGRRLIDPHLPREEKAQVFMECLLSSPYAEIISKLSQLDRDLTYEEIGESLAYDLRRDWTSLTKKIYGKKVITWLNAAELTEKLGPNSFRLKTVEIRETIRNKEEAKTQAVDVYKIYEVARTLGALEALAPTKENMEEFDNRISVLKSSLKEHADLELILDLLRKNFQLSTETENASIYRTNIEFVRDKVKEKLGMPIS